MCSLDFKLHIFYFGGIYYEKVGKTNGGAVDFNSGYICVSQCVRV